MSHNSSCSYAEFELLKFIMEPTNKEMDYLRSLHAITLKPATSSFDATTIDRPSSIIDNFLYQGDHSHACDMKVLNELGIRNILSMGGLRLEEHIYDNFCVLTLNIDDLIGVDIRQHFDQTNEFLQACRIKNEKVLVHCQAGISRSSSFILAYLLKYDNKTLLEAYDYLIERRPMVQPNDGFFLQLIRYEKELQNNKSNGATASSV